MPNLAILPAYTGPLRVSAIEILLGAAMLVSLASCGRRIDPATEIAEVAAPAVAASARQGTENLLVQMLQGAEIQAETDEQRTELRRALQDLRDKAAADLTAARYAGPDGKPGQRTLRDVLRAHIVPAQPVEIRLDQLIADRASVEGRVALDATISRVGTPIQ